ncbi:helix-turn-helix domain-containing protein [Novosphingobium mangrovi (ex Hu et al. 2023)]|uniref:Helix-turn-helix domain-containing protein n=1 Tax=Novosphingobium mangrovi (ex Hu et al. 2023) TaxID=2930094 RepID=A0ABT0ACN2_9SPHN|nr:helix-turn-helix domain-containing protein [Novosphingobium mangrovi (ex Hu et al. 2023)]MCJ1960963.1 helix-turn-helix domain-containing protein [Novosphingobium mangrovi (ex Hu et al. 2023)]
MAQAHSTKVNSRTFRWLGAEPLPASHDLRIRGWNLVTSEGSDEPGPGTLSLMDLAAYEALCESEAGAALSWTCRKSIMVIDIDSSRARADLLHAGIGDAIPADVCLEELDARGRLLMEAIKSLPRVRRLGRLRLDLLAREGYHEDTPLNLNPREFALIWRLAENIDRPVSKQSLIHDVWRMGFVPETNSIAVHMSRLRRKLAHVGIRDLIETIPGGGYSLRNPQTHGLSRDESRSAGTYSRPHAMSSASPSLAN